jgi:capsular exopolysaccharide synthesis family protein
MLRFVRRAKQQHQGQEESGPHLPSDRLVTVTNPSSAASEAYRGVRTNLLYSSLDGHPKKVIVLTSSGLQEGKSVTCANLGVVLAQADKKTLVLDCDFRNPTIHRFFGVPNLRGVTNVLLGERTLEEVWEEPVEGLKVVCVGPAPYNPAEVLGSRAFSEFLTAVREEFDYVLIDSSPVGLVSDTAVLSAQADGVLLVLDAQRTSKTAFRQATRSLENVGVDVLGTIMQGVRVKGR